MPASPINPQSQFRNTCPLAKASTKWLLRTHPASLPSPQPQGNPPSLGGSASLHHHRVPAAATAASSPPTRDPGLPAFCSGNQGSFKGQTQQRPGWTTDVSPAGWARKRARSHQHPEAPARPVKAAPTPPYHTTQLLRGTDFLLSALLFLPRPPGHTPDPRVSPFFQ
jgi:hypothetical protein